MFSTATYSMFYMGIQYIYTYTDLKNVYIQVESHFVKGGLHDRGHVDISAIVFAKTIPNRLRESHYHHLRVFSFKVCLSNVANFLYICTNKIH